MATRHNVTIQFPDRANYDRLKELAQAWGITLGAAISKLVDKDVKLRGISMGGKGNKKM